MFPLCPGFLKCDTVVLASLHNAQVMEIPEMVENVSVIYNTTTKLRAALVFVKCPQRFPASLFPAH